LIVNGIPGAAITASPLSVGLVYYESTQIATQQAVTLTNNTNAPVTITAITFSNIKNFNQGNNCGSLPASLAAGASCTVTVGFSPVDLGGISNGVFPYTTGVLEIDFNGIGGSQLVPLMGGLTF